jgi:hypothetical protein
MDPCLSAALNHEFMKEAIEPRMRCELWATVCAHPIIGYGGTTTDQALRWRHRPVHPLP